MKHGKVPRELEYLLDEARPELIECDSSLSLPSVNRGQEPKPCPHYDICLERCNHPERKVDECGIYKFYQRYGVEWNQMFI